MSGESKLHAGDWVEVRSKEEILRTLDERGCLEGLPFMPEMFGFCGRRLRVYKRAHKTCDFVTGCGGVRSLPNTVHLEDVRCDGKAHGGCEAGCMIFWKEQWVKPVAGPSGNPGPAEARSGGSTPTGSGARCTEAAVLAAVYAPGQDASQPDPVYTCQATLLPTYTRPLAWWDVRQYIEDRCSGNERSVFRMLPSVFYRCFDNLINLGIGLGPALRAMYDGFQRIRGGLPYPARAGKVPPGTKTPIQKIGCQPGDLVRVRRHEEILETLDHNCRNRGLTFSPEMVPYCGGTHRVLRRVNQIIDEKTGRMLRMKNDCIILDGVICNARYNKRMIFCPRATYAYWREAWLEPVGSTSTPVPEAAPSPARPD